MEKKEEKNDPQKESEIMEIVAQDGTVLKRDKNGRFLPGNLEQKRGIENKSSEANVAKMFNAADKATIVNLSQKNLSELKAIRDNPKSKLIEVINANLLIEAAHDRKWRTLLNRIMKTPERLVIEEGNISSKDKNSAAYQKIFVIPANGREAT